jgi:transposase, IS5 family
MMFLKFRYRLGYELVCREVADSISWQRFCRIPLGGQVPHPTTLVKLTRRLGEQTVTALNQALLHTAAEHKVLRTHKVRADTTVVAANVAYPTDAGLPARAIGKLQTTIQRIQATGGASRSDPPTAFWNKSWSSFTSSSAIRNVSSRSPWRTK